MYRKYGLLRRPYSTLTGDELMNKIRSIVGVNDRLGANAVWARLTVEGLRVFSSFTSQVIV